MGELHLNNHHNAIKKAAFMGTKADMGKIIRTFVMAAIAFAMLYPFLWMVAASFTQEMQIFNFPFKLIPDPVNLEGYKAVWLRSTLGYPMTVYFFNSVKVTAIALAGSILSCSMAAYGYSKIKFFGRDQIFLLKLSTMMIPMQVTMLPTFIIYRNLGLVDKHAAIWLGAFFGAAFGTFFLRQFFITIPYEMNEAAEIDGANHFRIFRQIIMPLAKPAVSALVVFNFMSIWNNYEIPLIYLRTARLYTLPLALAALSNDTMNIQFAGVMACAVSTAVPALIIFIAAQKYFIQGIAMSGMKM